MAANAVLACGVQLPLQCCWRQHPVGDQLADNSCFIRVESKLCSTTQVSTPRAAIGCWPVNCIGNDDYVAALNSYSLHRMHVYLVAYKVCRGFATPGESTATALVG